jgi:putative restriction endonuclease
LETIFLIEIEQDIRVRKATFEWLTEQVTRHGSDVLPRAVLAAGFIFGGVRVPLLGPQGIFKPKVLSSAPLSITTAPGGPYDDIFSPDGLLRYKYRGTDPKHPDNISLRTAMQHMLPLVYFHGLVPGKYVATWPVYIVADDPKLLTVTVAVDDTQYISLDSTRTSTLQDDGATARRSYITSEVRIRLHQRSFRERVLDAYHHQCAFCRFRHDELLSAAHIVADKDPLGEPLVRNGMALCTLHHGAFDRYFLGVRPDYIIEVRPDILREHDGPTLAHAIQALHGKQIWFPPSPTLRPDPKLLELRYKQFQHAF